MTGWRKAGVLLQATSHVEQGYQGAPPALARLLAHLGKKIEVDLHELEARKGWVQSMSMLGHSSRVKET